MKQLDSRTARVAHVLFAALLATSASFASGCDDRGDGSGGGGFVLGTLVFGPSDTTSYVSLLENLGPQTVDLAVATEVVGLADVWVHEGAVFVAESENLTIRKFTITDGVLTDAGTVSFVSYGLKSFGFYQNVFVSPTKAYMQNGVDELVIWNPETMTISTTIELPDFGSEADLTPANGYSDRSSALRDGRLYLTYYYSDSTYFAYAPVSKIVVVDIATDAVLDTITAPCPGLDHATIADDGAIYFSAWVFAPGAAAVLAQPATCVFKVPATGEPSVAFTVNELVEGGEGGVLRSIGGGRALLSVLHESHAAPGASAADVAYGNNWRFYVYDFATGDATRIESIDWNGGAQYTFEINGVDYMLVAKSDYSETTIYDVGDGSAPTPIFTTPGWSTRLFDTN